ncbi:hypothetical protein A2865_02350 [Candidatus Woesebacteria bacterium RIFCSPHIGHO2_01_FULL_39_17]|uniref:histidine kinase n=3 Tax=Candidatus Woeseibacteriota TaxID=1752722 RepID=A0A0G0RK20_9BACT|nr:MAG: two-component sensor histidine kinase [Microgenomates group bacterium GW2011_GWC1_38_12]KKQ93923.1 MAG: Sensor protein resE [Candidatus Woesebacteria bacterium GW2011_GWB1_39_10b]KKR13992.1 MAG: Sensor protein resE [Candidatus Woesebacteria bacterium GW2011_GWA1_39_21b]OGM23484.1 MAG: hypothetical protein A2865_02350 [Candidatus Woesebacteria bacterium RIFCSPHIGHO2_01_FULL_39_17]OGM64273.1 MAG: hypothetical protein A3A52_03175 [Candidatus Woesebacteria bacterium RIFCSPLOWO2_01_FULL_39_1
MVSRSTSSSYQRYKEVTKELYKKNLELFGANRELILLQKLYEITTSSLKLEDLTQRFIDVIVKDLNFLSAIVFLKNPELNSLKVIAMTKSKVNLIALKLFASPLSSLELPLDIKENIVAQAYISKRREVTHLFYKVFTPLITEEKAKIIEEVSKVKSTIVYPLVFGDESLGAFAVSMKKDIEDLSDSEKTALKRVSSVFGVAVNRLMIYQDLQIVNIRLKEIDAQKDEFISMAAHELRAPMTAIKGYVSMIIEGDTGDIPEKARGFLVDANAINERLIRLVNNMLNVSRIEEGRMVYQEEEENLSTVTRTVFAQFRPEAERKGLELKLDIPTSLKDKVRVDPDRIQEVIGNLLSNAIKYTDKGSVVVRLTQPNAKTVRFEVEDTGPGISKEEQEKLFKKFSRAESSVGKTTGTGLGLYISKLLVEKFGGIIGLASEDGKGSTFWFELPLVI